VLRLEVVEFDLDARQIRCNVELEDGEGGVWARIAGWCDWILKWSPKFDAAFRLPQRYALSDELQLPGLPEGAVCTVVTPDDLQHVDLEWAARMILHAAEMVEFNRLEPGNQRRQMLLSRMAAKDAARLWMARRRETELCHPSELQVVHDAAGRPAIQRPVVAGRAGISEWPEISVTHTDGATVALAAAARVGIDVEPESRNVRELLAEFASETEIALIDAQQATQPDEVWEARLWCAKEAASKALGTGLQGRPKSFRAIGCNGDGSFSLLHTPSDTRFTVLTVRCEGLVLAHTACEAAISAVPL
jgi:phosphopantetheinyl transferase